MKNLAALMEQIKELGSDYKEAIEAVKTELFELYAKIDGLNQVFKDLENCENGHYYFNSYSDLCYGVSVPKEYLELPMINDYLTDDCFNIEQENCGHNEILLYSFHGPCITINFQADRNEYFIYNHDSRKVIIEKELEWMDERYIAAVLELYQIKSGCFGDIVKIDYYGSYAGHFDTFKALGINTQCDENDLKKIINKIENENNNQDEG